MCTYIYIRLDKDKALCFFNKALVNLALDQYLPALQDVERALEHSPDFGEAHLTQGNKYVYGFFYFCKFIYVPFF